MRKTDHNTYAEEKPHAIVLGEPIYFCPQAGAPPEVEGSCLWSSMFTGRIEGDEYFFSVAWSPEDREVGVAHELGHIYFAAQVGEARRVWYPQDIRCAHADSFAARMLGKTRVLATFDKTLRDREGWAVRRKYLVNSAVRP